MTRWLAPQVVAYLAANALLNVGNKQVLQAFPFPIAMIMVGLLVSVPLAWALSRWQQRGASSTAAVPGSAAALHLSCAAVGAMHGLGTACQNISLDRTSLALNQIIKAMSPAVTMVLSVALMRHTYHWSLVLCTALIIAGSVLTTFSTPELSHVGLWTGVASCVFGGVESVICEWALRSHGVSVAALQVLVGCYALVALLVPFAVFEPQAAFHLARLLRRREALLAVAGLSVVAFVYSLLHYSLIKSTSAHYTNLIGSFKLAFVVLLSVAFLGGYHTMTVANGVGTVLTLAAFFAYSALKTRYDTKQQQFAVAGKDAAVAGKDAAAAAVVATDAPHNEIPV